MFDFDDVYEIGAEIAVGSITGAAGAKIGEKIVGFVTDNEIAKNISSIIGAGVGASIGVDFVDSLFNDE